jgi:hypothetical protein
MFFTKEDIICTDKYLQLESDRIAYIKTDILHNGADSMIWRNKHHATRPAPIWITGHSDYPITGELYKKYQHNCRRWFAINKDCTAGNIYGLPLGITNNTNESNIHPIYGDTDIMISAMQLPRRITNLVYMNFSIYTYPTERTMCYNIFKDKPWVTLGTSENTLAGRRRFLEDIRNHKFVLCPRGNGIDTHRLWETLYMGSIPIVKRHIALAEFNDLPILFIDDWNEVTEEMLHNKYAEITSKSWNMDKLKISYWKNLITTPY